MEQDINRPMGACALVGHGKQVAKSSNKAYFIQFRFQPLYCHGSFGSD